MREENNRYYISTPSFGNSNFYDFAELADLDEAAWTEAVKDIEAKISATFEKDKENQIRKIRRNNRSAYLISMYDMILTSTNTGFSYVRKPKFEHMAAVDVSVDILESYSDETWDGVVKGIDQQITDLKNLEKAEADRLEKEKEEIRKAALSDVEKVREYMKRVLTVGTSDVPQLQDQNVLTAFANYQTKISQAEDELLRFLETLQK